MLGKDASSLFATFITVAKHGGGDGKGEWRHTAARGRQRMGFPKKIRDLMYTCKLMTAEGINLALEK